MCPFFIFINKKRVFDENKLRIKFIYYFNYLIFNKIECDTNKIYQYSKLP